MSNDRREWQAAMEDQMKSLNENETWTLTELPDGRNAIDSRWIYRIKEKPYGTISRYKARLVAKGYSERPNIDYSFTFAPDVKMDSLRVVLALTTLQDMEMIHFDIRTAFLYGEIDEMKNCT